MTLMEVTEMWKILHNTEFWESFELYEKVDRETLVSFLMQEYEEFEILDYTAEKFRWRVETFFKTHYWNIEKLVNSMYFYYNPIGNTNFHMQEYWERTEDIKNDWERDETINTDSERNETDHTTDIKDREWTEKGQSNETDTYYVSAFNDVESRENSITDTEHDRRVVHNTYSKDGTEDITTNTDTTENETNHSTQVEDEERHETQNELEKKGTINDEWGHRDAHSFQELIEEERKQAQFNIYKWIGNHFSTECLICVW